MTTLFESVIDPELDTYSPYVFENPEDRFPKIKDLLRDKILRDGRKINDVVKVVDMFIKGSILTKHYNPRSDIDIFIRVKSDKSEKELRDLLYPIWKEIDDRYIKGVPHPLQYYITAKPYDLKNTEAAYSIKENEWIKKTSTTNIDVDDYMKDYKKYVDQFADFSEEIRRDMIDVEVLREIPKSQLKNLDKKIQRQINKLEKSLNDLVDVYTMLSDFRNKAFSDDMTPSEIKKYGIKTRLPGNVVFKMIERYHYVDLAKKIRKIIGSDGELSMKEYKQLNKLLKTNPINPSVKFKEVFESNELVNSLGPKAGRPQPRHHSPKYGAGKTTKMADMHKKSPLKIDNKVDVAKSGGKVIRVKQGSPEAKRLAAKYRIDYPVGKKTVGGNQNDSGITIIFESDSFIDHCEKYPLDDDQKELLENKVKRAQQLLDTK